MDKFKKELKLKCAQYRIDFIEADVRKGYKQVLMPYLIKREKMLWVLSLSQFPVRSEIHSRLKEREADTKTSLLTIF